MRISVRDISSLGLVQLVSCSTQLSMYIQLLITLKCCCLTFKLLDDICMMLINIKMPTNAGVLIFMSMINACSVELNVTKRFIISRPDCDKRICTGINRLASQSRGL